MIAPALTPRRPGRRSRAAVDCPRPQAGASGAPEPTLFDEPLEGPGGQPTLEELIVGVWDGLVAHQRVPCPLCGGEMAPGDGAHARTLAGRCADCGTSLS